MDLTALREAAIEATERALQERLGLVPEEDSDDYEAEYRKQFALLRERYGGQLTTRRPALSAAAPERNWPELRGTLEEQHWGTSIRDERLHEIPSEAVRLFLVQTWPRAKQWIDTRDVPTRTLLQRLASQYEEWRKKRAEATAARKADARQKAAAAAAHQQKLQAAGITVEGLVELVDASDRFDPAPITTKLTELAVEGRHLRLFETSDPNLLLVKEKKGPLQLPDYAIERDEAIVEDLRLYGQAP